MGTPYTDLLKNKSQILAGKVQYFNTSNTSKNEAVTNMQVALENSEVSLLPVDKLKRQFSYFTATYNPKTRNVSYAAPEGLNDDIVMATLFAFQAYKEGTVMGNYNISGGVIKYDDTHKHMMSHYAGRRAVTKSINYLGK